MNNISKLIENNKRPLNETETHYLLKQIGKYLLRARGCKLIGTEVDIGHDHSYLLRDAFEDNSNYFKTLHKRIPDVIGVKCSNVNWRTDSKTIIIESKASLSDYKNGFCTYADYTYVICPINTIPHDKIPKGIGLFEVDLDNYKPVAGMDFIGVNQTIVAKNRSKIIKSNPHYYENVIYSIGNRFTNYDIFNDCQIQLYDVDDLTIEELSIKYGKDLSKYTEDDLKYYKKALKRQSKVK